MGSILRGIAIIFGLLLATAVVCGVYMDSRPKRELGPVVYDNRSREPAARPAPAAPPVIEPRAIATPADASPTATGSGNHAARVDFIAQVKKHPEFPFRVSLGRADTELAMELTDPNDECTRDLVDKFIKLLVQIGGGDFTRITCRDQRAAVTLGPGRVGSHAQRQAFIDEAQKAPDLGFTLSFGQVDTDLMLELTGTEMPCSKEALMTLVEPLGAAMRAAGYKHFRCKGPWLAVDISPAPAR